MLQRIHLTVTVALFIAVLFLGWSSITSGLAAERAAEVAAAMRADALRLVSTAPREPVEHVVIEVGDVLEILDDYNAEVSGKQEVAADGKVLLPDAGWVRVAGLTREQAEQALTGALAPYFVHAQVRVRVTKAE
jgi:protein involved in polysaccharide export with SLBB domain